MTSNVHVIVLGRDPARRMALDDAQFQQLLETPGVPPANPIIQCRACNQTSKVELHAVPSSTNTNHDHSANVANPNFSIRLVPPDTAELFVFQFDDMAAAKAWWRHPGRRAKLEGKEIYVIDENQGG